MRTARYTIDLQALINPEFAFMNNTAPSWSPMYE